MSQASTRGFVPDTLHVVLNAGFMRYAVEQARDVCVSSDSFKLMSSSKLLFKCEGIYWLFGVH
jgi:hypothetical protein